MAEKGKTCTRMTMRLAFLQQDVQKQEMSAGSLDTLNRLRLKKHVANIEGFGENNSFCCV